MKKYTFHQLDDLPLLSDKEDKVSPPPTSSSENEKQNESFGSVRMDFPSARCLLLKKILEKKECESLIDRTEKIGYTALSKEYPEEYRNNERVLVKSEKLAKKLWERICSRYGDQVKDMAKDVTPFGVDSEGTWEPFGINEVIKFARYSPGQRFLPHMDNRIVLNEDVRSIFTLIIYLNQDFEGGATHFFSRPQDGKLPFLHKSKSNRSDCDQCELTVHPVTGHALLFNHDVVHDGDELINGYKYIIRAEVMFKRTSLSASVLGNTARVNDSTMGKTSYLYSKADMEEEKGDLKSSTQTYLHALETQVNYSSCVPVEQEDYSLKRIPPEIMRLIMHFLDYKCIVQCCSLLNRRWNYWSGESTLWKRLYEEKWKHDIPNSLKEGDNYYFHFRDRILGEQSKGIVLWEMGTCVVRVGFRNSSTGKELPCKWVPAVFRQRCHPHQYVQSQFFIGEAAYGTSPRSYESPSCEYVFHSYYRYHASYFARSLAKMLNIIQETDKKGGKTTGERKMFVVLPTDCSFYPDIQNEYNYDNADMALFLSENFKEAYQIQKHIAAVVGSGIQNGILCHYGYSNVVICAVYNGKIIHIVQMFHFGFFRAEEMIRKNCQQSKLIERHVFTDLARELCTISLDPSEYKKEKENFSKKSVNLEGKSKLFSGTTVEASRAECVMAGERLFVPTKSCQNSPKFSNMYFVHNISELPVESLLNGVKSCVEKASLKIATPDKWLKDGDGIVLSGTTTKLQHFPERFTKEKNEIPLLKNVGVKCDEDRHMYAWKGLVKMSMWKPEDINDFLHSNLKTKSKK